jgi:hypothetical protein
MNEIKVAMQNIEMMSALVVKQQKQYESNPMHNEYMKLQWNLGALNSAIIELQELMGMNN